MRTFLVSTVISLAFGGMAIAGDEAHPVTMTDAQMDLVVAGDLTLPNGNVVFSGFDNPAPGDWHPGLSTQFGGKRSEQASNVSGSNASGLLGTEGPWSAHFANDNILCNDC
jgi:hypothetical protein